VTGHGIPRFVPRPRKTFGADLGRNAAQIWQRRGFILARDTAAAKGALLLPVNNGIGNNGLVARLNLRSSGYKPDLQKRPARVPVAH